MQKTVQVGLIQMTCGDNIAANYAKAVACIRQAADQGAQIVCLQELFKSRYFCQVVDNRLFDLAEDRDRFGALLDSLDIPHPQYGTATSIDEALEVGRRIGFPLVVSVATPLPAVSPATVWLKLPEKVPAKSSISDAGPR